MSPLSAGYKHVCVWHLKKESISFQDFHYLYLTLTSPVDGGSIQLQRKAVRAVFYLLRILIHNDRFRQQCQPQTILCHINLSLVERCSDSGNQWWMRHLRRFIHISHYGNKQYRHRKWILPGERTRATQLTWQSGGKKTSVKILTFDICVSQMISERCTLYCGIHQMSNQL